MLVTRVRKETKETQEYKERLVCRDHLAHKVGEVVGLCYHNQYLRVGHSHEEG